MLPNDVNNYTSLYIYIYIYILVSFNMKFLSKTEVVSLVLLFAP